MSRLVHSGREARSAFTWLLKDLAAKAAFSGPSAEGHRLNGLGIKGKTTVALAFGRISTRSLYAAVALAAAVAAPAPAQQTDDQSSAAATPDTTHALKLPEKLQVFGNAMPSVIKATAIVNGDVITQTDVDQRLALLAIANGGQIPAEEVDRLRQQVLRNLIDESLQVQAA